MIFLLILSLIISLPLNSNYSSPARIYKSTLSPAFQTTPRFSNLKINPSRLLNNLEKLATFGQIPEGGVNRVAFSDEDLAARNFIIELMRNAGLRVRIDAAANIIGYRPGLNPELPSLAMGSHLDTVPQGGKYDGALGVLSAIEVAQTLAENKIATRYPLEVIVFTDEEGGLVGSRAMTGTLTPAAMEEKSHSGWTIAEGIKRLGGDPTRIDSAARSPGELAAFVELHIEQGAWLERNNIAVGVVEGIVGINWWDIFIEGQANHAGTTPMNMRRDALLAAAHLIIAVNQI
ncbi:MAG TPA: Zn-dependent hydrolase, partial [Candidatus Aminicenantes bacterium]|nr:Zn-dependent hydrolase [Candidatus Aminicenantes bacterium]